MINLRWLHVLDFYAAKLSSGSSRLAAVITALLTGRTAAEFLQPVVACAAILLATGLRLHGAPVMNADVAQLLSAGMTEQVILQTIAVGQPNFDLSPDALIALKNKGATPAILSAMLATAQSAVPDTPPPPPLPTDVTAASVEVPSVPPVASAPPTPTTPPPAVSAPVEVPIQTPPTVEPAEVSLAYFQGQLAPYGNWVQLPGYGLCWQPAVASEDGSWRPYCDAGHWAYTDQGWFWESEYPWGDVVFHYGRWLRHPGYGWIWAPDYTWAPSWVAWRHNEAEGFIGWAPLPPAARFVAGVGLCWNGRAVFDVDFGLGPADFCFVGSNHYWERDLRGYVLRPERAQFIWRHSEIRNGYRFNNGRFIVEGLRPQRIAVLTRHPVRAIEVREFAQHERHEHFVARQREVVRHVEIRREEAARGVIRHEQVRPVEIHRQQPVPQRHEDGRLPPPPAPVRRAEPPRQTQPAVNPPPQRMQPAVPSAKTAPAAKPQQRAAPKTEDKKDPNAKQP